MQLPPRPPATRIWKGSAVAPFAGNNMLVLYSCPANSSDEYFVQVLHNEEPIAMPVSALTTTGSLISFLIYNSRLNFFKNSILMSWMHKRSIIKAHLITIWFSVFENKLRNTTSTPISLCILLSLFTNIFKDRKLKSIF